MHFGPRKNNSSRNFAKNCPYAQLLNDDVDDDDDDEEEAAPAPVQKAAPAPSKKAPAAPAPKANAGGNINEEQLLHAIRKSNLKEPLLDAIKKAKNQ